MGNYLMYENKQRNNKLNTQNFLPPIVIDKMGLNEV